MLTQQENELLTRTGANTRMGNLMRRYWIPALLSTEIAHRDGPPVRAGLLGEKLVAFRDSAGRVGLLNEFCAHRCASLFLGRNEEGGLRCIYHGWKYDIEGKCLETPTEPQGSTLKEKIRIKAYPTVEMGGVVWAYMGPAEKMPVAPKFEWTQVADSHRHVSKMWEECNWLQALEGAIDTAHASFLHRAISPHTKRPGLKGYWEQSQTPTLEIELTDYGYVYAATRPLPEEKNYVRTYQYVMPFHQFFPSQLAHSGTAAKFKKPMVRGHMFVPMDDENCMVYNWTYTFGEAPLSDEEQQELDRHIGSSLEERTVDYRKTRNRDNNWIIDRRVQKTETYTGIEGINTQDHAIQESMGPIVDRTLEHLGSTDKAIVAARLLLLRTATKLNDEIDPPGTKESYFRIRAIEKILASGVDWRGALKAELCLPHLSNSQRPNPTE
ncbi:MAG TPA: Rieske 2Fe-2S domain-containing protein [Candidatus Binatia bacterium]|jgi:phenylpropionate dioxygenase-like ring-hydroxylating dioxygenase large terminal subunit